MKWANALMAVTFLLAGASVWACGDDDSAPPKKTTASTGSCDQDDPMTPDVDESECKAIATVESGHTAVTTRGCPACHGDDMSGASMPLTGKPEYAKTVTGLNVALYPPNLTADQATGVGSWNDDALALAIRSGVDKDSVALCPQMTHFSKMSDFEVYSIVMYLRSIPTVSKQIPRSVCPPTKP